MIRDKLTLVQFFDLRINEEGYWNYFHMALQIEYVFNVLSVKFQEYDFVVLMDQNSGHGKKMEEGLNAIEMSMRFGGSQKNVKHNNQRIGHLPCPIKCWRHSVAFFYV